MMRDPQFGCLVLLRIFEGGTSELRKRLRLSQASTVVALLESVVDALEMDLSHFSTTIVFQVQQLSTWNVCTLQPAMLVSS